MTNEDELLERAIQAQERKSAAQPIQPVDGELAELARLAQAIRFLPHPALEAEQARQQRRALLALQQPDPRDEKAAPATKSAGTSSHPAAPLQRNVQLPTPRQPSRNWLLIPAAAGMMLVLLIGILGLLDAGLWMRGPRNSQTAVFEGVHGQVEVAAVDWDNPQPVQDGDRIETGQRVRTGEGSQATLVFFDGSRTSVGPTSDLTLSRVDGDWGKVLRVVMIQTAGKTNHQVVPLRGEKSYFLVFTPSGEVSVHGTRFNIAVDTHGSSRFGVDEGRILVTDRDAEVYLAAGQAAASGPGENLTETGYQFTLQGKLNGKKGSLWRTAGLNYLIRDTTDIHGKFKAGAFVVVEGRILEDGTWVADSIRKAHSDERLLQFDGILQQTSADAWVVGGQTIALYPKTELPVNAGEDSTVRVSMTRAGNQGWQAQKIETLEQLAGEHASAQTDPPDASAEPELSFEPDELENTVCANSPSLTGTLVNLAQEQDDVAEEVVLDHQITLGAEFVDGVVLAPSGWDIIPAAGQEEFQVKIALNAARWGAAPSGTEIKVRVFVAEEKNRPEGHDTRLTVTLVKDCAETPTKTPQETRTGTPTGTVTGSPTPGLTGTPTPVVNCTGANPHPTGQKLALRYGVPYTEIMGWFCQGFGFGEIDLAYGLSRASGVPVTTIFDLRKSGLGWGVIKKLVWGLPTGTPTGQPTGTQTMTPTVTPTGTLTPQVTGTPSPTPDPPLIPGKRAKCTGGSPHPTGLTLSQRFGVPYEEIMGWFCRGFGFGEIDLAYDLSLHTGTPVTQVFSLRSSGMGWGQVRKHLLGDNPGGIYEDEGNMEDEGGNGNGFGPGNPGNGNGGNPGKGKGKKDK